MTHPLSAFAPAVTPPRLPASDVSYVVEDSPVGRLLLAVTADGALVTSVYAADARAEDVALQKVADAVSPRVLRHPAALDEARRQLAAYLDGRTRTMTHRLDLSLAGAFQRDVLTTLVAGVGYGQRTTYGDLAEAASHPGASRAVGSALGRNPLCLFVPCHRVVPAGGGLGGYAGGPGAKAYLLDLEARAATR